MTKTPEKLYYCFDAWGLLDLRKFGCIRYTVKDAVAEARRIEEKNSHMVINKHSLDGAKVGDWYDIHEFGGYAHGPFETKRQAEIKRRKAVTDEQSFCGDIGGDPGFVGQVVKVLKTTVVAVRDARRL